MIIVEIIVSNYKNTRHCRTIVVKSGVKAATRLVAVLPGVILILVVILVRVLFLFFGSSGIEEGQSCETSRRAFTSE